MHSIVRIVVAASTLGCLVATAELTTGGTTFAQAGSRAADTEAPPKQIALTQKQIDGVLSAQKEIRAIEEKLPQGGAEEPDPKIDAQLDAVAKKNGLAGVGEYADVSSSIGIVMAGMDPQTKKYVGPQVVINKQIAEVKADKAMPPKEKKEALDELSSVLNAATSAQPLPGNIELVSKNFDKLSQSLQQDAD